MTKISFDNLPEAVAELFEKLNNIERLLQENGTQPTSETDQLLTIQEAANFLTLSVHTLYGHVHRASIPVNKRGGRLYFSKQELTEWVKAGRRSTTTETADRAAKHTAISTKKRRENA